MDQVKFVEGSLKKKFNWSILEYFVPYLTHGNPPKSSYLFVSIVAVLCSLKSSESNVGSKWVKLMLVNSFNIYLKFITNFMKINIENELCRLSILFTCPYETY